MIVAVIIVYIMIALIQMPSLIRQKLWRELATFLVLLGIGFILSLLQVIGVRIPSPNEGIIFLIKHIENIFR